MIDTKLIATLILIPISWIYLGWVMRRFITGLLSDLPEDRGDRAKELWDRIIARKERVGVWQIPACAPIFLLLTIDADFGTIAWRFLTLIAFVWFAGCAWVMARCNFELDRSTRATTWQSQDFVRYALTFWTWRLMIPLIAILILEICRQLAPAYYDSEYWRLAVGASAVVAMIAGRPLAALVSKNLRFQRSEDASLIEVVSGLCETAKVKPAKVFEIRETGGRIPLAFATKSGVIISQFLKTDLTPEELRAIAAHEIAHIALRHLWKRQAILLIPLLLIAETLVFATPETIKYLFSNTPLTVWVIPFLLFTMANAAMRRLARLQEFAADVYGARLIGDTETMATALEKIHDLASLPAEFPKKAKMTHPSLTARMDRIRSLSITQSVEGER
jgi:Zn-dependent protease with chaperone function